MQKKPIKFFVTGGHGMLGTAVVKVLNEKGIPVIYPSSQEMDLLDADVVRNFIKKEEPTHLIHLASKVYGLQGNLRNQLSSLSINTRINDNIFNALVGSSVEKVFFAGTVASYPFPYVNLPLEEQQLFYGAAHKGEYGYANSKLHAYHYLYLLKEYHGIDFVYGLFTNLFGTHDKFDLENGHVVPSLISKAYYAKLNSTELSVWGSPETTRDFLYIEDAANAVMHLTEHCSGVFNIASGETHTMLELAEEICRAAKVMKPILWKSDKPIGIPRRSVDSTKLFSTGFKCSYTFSSGIHLTYDWYENNLMSARHN